MQSLIVALAAVGTGVVLLLSGALDEEKHVDIDSATSTTIVTGPLVAPQDKVMIDYLTAFATWTTCAGGQTADASAAVVSSACGTLPEQPDDPQLNAYLASVLDWNKCAAPRLRRGGLEHAIIACGPQPVSPIGD